MNKDEAAQIRKYIHDARNPLNSITLHAELGKMLLENNTGGKDVENALSVILKQCSECEKLLSKIQNLSTS